MEGSSNVGMTSHKRRLDNFLQGIESRSSSPAKQLALGTETRRPATPTRSTSSFTMRAGGGGGGDENTESSSAKRQRLGLGSSSHANRNTGPSSSSELLKKWSTAAAAISSNNSEPSSSTETTAPTTSSTTLTPTPGFPSFSAKRSSILLVNNPNNATFLTSSKHVGLRSSAQQPPAPALYNPCDRAALLARLATFQELTDWTPKPERASEIEWARRGWTCKGRERVACALCRHELVVGLNRKEVNGKEVSVLVASEIEEALVDKYVEKMVTDHAEDCPWRKLGCDETLLKVPLSHGKDALADLRARYDELLERKEFLPYEFNLRLPAGLDLDSVTTQLPPDFFATSTDSLSPNRVALALALLGWQCLSNPRMGRPIKDSVSCHTCLRRLGLWMFKSKEVAADGRTVVTPAAMDHLDPVTEHRFFCPWKNPTTQRTASTPDPITDMPAWKRLVQIVRNEASIRGALSDEPRPRSFLSRTRNLVGGSSGGSGEAQTAPSTPVKNSGALTSPNTPGSSGALGEDDEEDEKTRDAKEKAMYSRLRRIKSIFATKGSGGRLSRSGTKSQASSRPGTSHSPSVPFLPTSTQKA